MEIKYIDRKSGDVKTENPPAKGLLKLIYTNPFGKLAILPLAKKKMVSSIYGKRMDKPSSKKTISKFVKTHHIDMSESEKSVEEFLSFNDFFYRKLKQNMRPIENGFVSPGDGKLLAFEDINSLQHFFVKGEEFTLAKFLNDESLANSFTNASLLILRLAVNDYHRFHFPYEGIPSEINKIKGYYCSVSPYALRDNFVKVFCENKREYCVLSTEEKGKIVIAPVGATMVGSIVETYKPNVKVKKGDEMGYFAFGGSSIVILIDRNAIKIDKDILKNTSNNMETYVKMGEKIGE